MSRPTVGNNRVGPRLFHRRGVCGWLGGVNRPFSLYRVPVLPRLARRRRSRRECRDARRQRRLNRRPRFPADCHRIAPVLKSAATRPSRVVPLSSVLADENGTTACVRQAAGQVYLIDFDLRPTRGEAD